MLKSYHSFIDSGGVSSQSSPKKTQGQLCKFNGMRNIVQRDIESFLFQSELEKENPNYPSIFG